MSASVVTPLEPQFSQRIIGRFSAAAPGPMLVAVGSIHGNEPAGRAALERITNEMASKGGGSFLERGDFVALVGNLTAGEARARFIDHDLNRGWSPERVERIASSEGVRSIEDRELRDLVGVLRTVFAEARGPIALVDLHTTSGDGKPFSVFADTLRSRRFARAFPVPSVLGLEEKIESTLVDYVGLLGHVAVGFEGGQHEQPRSVDHLATIVWLAMGILGLIDPSRQPNLDEGRRLLGRETSSLPRILEVTYRHGVAPADGFRMHPGFGSFQPVTKGQVIAGDVRGSVLVPQDGYLLMPLYQELGDDGFFVVRRVWGGWLLVSAALRYLGLWRVAHWLPGVSRDPDLVGALRVNRRVAKWYSLEILHLLGFRKRTETGDLLVVERRNHD